MGDFKTADEILAADDRKTLVVHVPEWNTDITLRELSGAQREVIEFDVLDSQGRVNTSALRGMRVKLLSMSIVHHETLKPLFGKKDMELLAEKSAVVLDRLFDEAQKLSGLVAGAVEEEEKN